MDQQGISTEELIDGQYAAIDFQGVQDIIFWEQDGEALMLYVSAELNYTDALPYCTASKYVRNEKTGAFELEKETQ